jgi:drug/metabolite transporter (DMT)-like permease
MKIDVGTLYLLIGAALIFGAGVYASKRILRQLTMKQLGLISIVTLLTLGAIWGFLTFSSRKRAPAQSTPDLSQPTPLLPPAPD